MFCLKLNSFPEGELLAHEKYLANYNLCLGYLRHITFITITQISAY